MNPNLRLRAHPLIMLVILAIIEFCPPPALAAIAEAWIQHYSGVVKNSVDQASKVLVDRAGDVIVSGTTDGHTPESDVLTIKYSGRDGSVLWQRRFNGPNYTSAGDAAVDASGNVVVTGSYGCSYLVVKYAAADGAPLWERNIPLGCPETGLVQPVLAMDHDGNVAVSGASLSFRPPVGFEGHNSDFFIAKYATADGALLWEQLYDGPAHGRDYSTAMAVDTKGNLIVTGSWYNGGGIGDYYTAKYAAADGRVLWARRQSDPGTSVGAFPTAVAVDALGNVVVTGSIENEILNLSNADYYTVKYAAADGALLWEKRYNGPADFDDRAQALAVDGDGNVVVTGYSFDTVEIIGNVYDFPRYDYAFYTAKYRAHDGGLLWARRYNGPAGLHDRAVAVVADANGNVVVTGSSVTGGRESTGFINDFYTAKYAAADGAVLWEKLYNSPSNGDDFPSSLALGPNGIVALTGSSAGFRGLDYDFATIVYREGLPPITIDFIPAGVRLTSTGLAGQSYSVERAPAVTGPWSILDTARASASGLLEHIDSNPSPATAFYRLAIP